MTKYNIGSLVYAYPFRFRMSRLTSAENLRYSFIAGDIAFKMCFFFISFITRFKMMIFVTRNDSRENRTFDLAIKSEEEIRE